MHKIMKGSKLFFEIIKGSDLDIGAFCAFDLRKDVNYAKLDT